MITAQDRKAFTDLSIIIKMMPTYMQEKINNKFIDLIEQNKDFTYVSNIKSNIPLKHQKLSETTEAILAMIYRDFLCSEEERKQLLISEQHELQKIEEKNKKKYEIDFEKRNQYLNTKNPITCLIEYKKETFITKIINKIKIFLKNKL